MTNKSHPCGIYCLKRQYQMSDLAIPHAIQKSAEISGGCKDFWYCGPVELTAEILSGAEKVECNDQEMHDDDVGKEEEEFDVVKLSAEQKHALFGTVYYCKHWTNGSGIHLRASRIAQNAVNKLGPTMMYRFLTPTFFLGIHKMTREKSSKKG